MSWAVKAETHQGTILVLKSGYETEDEALDYRVRGKYYKRVWVEKSPLPSLWSRRPWERLLPDKQKAG